MEKRNKKRDPMPPPDATPEEIGEFWDTHSLADYWDETDEVEFQVDLKSNQNQTQPGETKPDLPSTAEDASNTTLDVVTDLALDAAIPAPIRKNAFKAFDRLCSALINVPVGALERRSAEKQAESEARIKIIRENADKIAQQMKVDPEYARIAVSKYGQKILREQVNLDNISAIAADELKSIESDNPTRQKTNEPNQEQSADSTNQDTNGGEEKIINDDWLNNFETEARQKSTEEMQIRFGRVLAGEIRQPGSYSIKAIKLFGEIDQNTAILFKKFCSVCVVIGVFGIPNSEQVFDARVLSLGGSLGSNALSKYGLDLDQLNILNEYSLITSSDISLHDYNLISLYDYNLCIVYENNPVPSPFQHQGKPWALLPLPDWDNKSEFKLSGVALSRVGRELFRIVDQDPMPEYTEDLKKFFAGQKLQMVEVPNPDPIILKGPI